MDSWRVCDLEEGSERKGVRRREKEREVNGEGEVQRDAVTMWSKLAGVEMVGLMGRKAEKLGKQRK